MRMFRESANEIIDITEEASKKKGEEYWDPSNYAKIPDLIPKNAPQYQAVLKVKNNSLKDRQYSIIE